ncbi:HNH endonuclease [Pseudoalteromonas sp. SR45-1]|uniref:HNH endonuclease signature motif containing protein n=1 Tax=Pseudoalteromonas sp. SR45-1 TaxID=2760932 RepID=UPI0016026A2A|nr:HNH endonuclease signature motif containing protein [Pseudoalteromonas sp. SR45-1]MBB1326298.1 HNH endonuclease [Pseudoalteromonas sp. SR45-1]
MSKSTYDEPRPTISADLRRAVNVESGHTCAIKGCAEHTYLEIHHIDENRENNTLENLVLLCDKHHKMAHAKVIDRKALREYKKLLSDNHDSQIIDKIEELKELVQGQKNSQPISEPTDSQPVDEHIKRLAPKRFEILNFALYHVAIAHYEKSHNLYFEHQVEYVKGDSKLMLDALRQDDDLPEDIIIEVQYFRKPYMDAPVYGSWVEKKVELYELLTGRQARGVLLVIVGRERMASGDYLNLTRKGVEDCSRNISIEVYTCEEVGFHPGAISTAMFQSNLKSS